MDDKEALSRLINMFYANSIGELEWSYVEGVTVDSMDEELAEYMKLKARETEEREDD